MEQTIAYQCPNCGAGVEFSTEEHGFSCPFCLSKFTEEEIKAANSEETVRERESAREEYNAQMNEYQCPNCGAANDPGTKFCRECGAKLETPPPAEPQKRFCPSCGKEVAPGIKFCPECGQKME